MVRIDFCLRLVIWIIGMTAVSAWSRRVIQNVRSRKLGEGTCWNELELDERKKVQHELLAALSPADRLAFRGFLLFSMPWLMLLNIMMGLIVMTEAGE